MSGSTIGGVVGGVIGFVVSGYNPQGFQVGWMVGSAIGGYVDPTKVEGPRLKDATTQTSQEGIPIPFGFGTYPTAGNIIWCDKLKEHKKKDNGKGSGTVQVTYSYTRSYAIGIAEGAISGLLMVKRNGKTVWDARDQSTINDWMAGGTPGTPTGAIGYFARLRAVGEKWSAKAAIYMGSESQLPDPTMEAVEGVGNVPAHRGLAYIVVKDDDVTELQGAIPQYEFVVATVGTSATVGSARAAGVYGRFANTTFPLVDDESHYVLEGSRAGSATFTANTIAEIVAHFATTYGPSRPPSVFLGYGAANGVHASPLRAQPDITNNESIYLVYNEVQPDHWVDAAGGGFCTLIPDTATRSEYYGDQDGNVLFMTRSTDTTGYKFYNNCTNQPSVGGYYPTLIGTEALYIRVTRKRAAPDVTVAAGFVPIPDAPGFYVNDAGDIVSNAPWSPVVASHRVLATPAVPQTTPNGQVRAWWEIGPAIAATDARYSDAAFWTAQYDAAVARGALPSGWVYSDAADGTDFGYYPKTVTTAYAQTPDNGTELTTASVSLASVIASLCARIGLSGTEVDVAGITSRFVLGYKVASTSGVDAMIGALMPAYFFDAAEYDGALHFIPRGGDVTFSISYDDLAARDGDPLTLERVQEAELLRKVTVGHIDPLTSYTAATQSWERRSGTVQAKGESAIEIPIVCSRQFAAQVAEKRGKVAWSETEKATLSLPALKWARLTPATVGVLYTRDGTPIRIRLGQIDEDSGTLLIEASRDRQQAYTGTAPGALPPPPQPADPPLTGPTRLAVMDLPVWRETDDALGVYVAANGMLGGWRGAQVQVSTDGGLTFVAVAEMTSAATMGATTTALDAGSADYPSAQSLTVQLNDSPASVNYAALLRYANRAAVQLASGAWEILQFQTVTTNADGSYTLSGLARGRYATTPGAIVVGARFVLLDEAVKFVPIEAWTLGRPLLTKAVGYGIDPDAVTATPITLSGQSQREWAPTGLSANRDGSNNVTVAWIGRGRIGAEVSARNSAQFAGYRVTFSDGVTVDTTATTYTRTATPAGVSVSVAALNTITGAGPSTEALSV